jgi:putative ABC transport system permease protein
MPFRGLRHAARGLWHARSFAAVAILCLGIGIGFNTTIFSLIDGVLLKPLPYAEPDRLLVLGMRNQEQGVNAGLSFPDMRDWKEATTSFTSIAASLGRSMAVSDPGREPERYLGALVSWDLFPLLGVEPILGRTFTRDEDRPNAAGVVLLSHMVWTTRYAADPSILGQGILVDGRMHTVVGVMPPRFAFPENHRLWTPLEPGVSATDRTARSLFAFARLKPGIEEALATEDLQAVAARITALNPTTNEGWSPRVRTLRDAAIPADVRLVLTLMMAGVTLVLFIACSNVANLLLARTARRSREFAVRAAIGAGRGRVIKQLLAEGLLLALASVPLGLGLAVAGTRLLSRAMPPDEVPYYITWSMDARSAAYAVVVSLLVAVVFAIVPAVQIAGRDLHESLKEGGRGNTGGRAWVRNALVVTQVSLALVALVGALLFVRTYANLDTYSLGFETRPLMTLRYFMTGEGYAQEGARARRTEDIVRRIEALPGVTAAFASNLIPLSGGGGGGEIEIEGRPNEEGRRPRIALAGVSPRFVETLGAAIVHGRDFDEGEGWSRAPVAMVNQTLARRFWPDQDPLERRFRVRTGGPAGEWYRVIGVMADVQLYGVDPEETEPLAAAFVPYGFQESLNTGLTIRVAAGDPAAIVPSVRAAIRASDPYIPLAEVATMDTVRQSSYWQYGLFGWVFGSIGAIGLVLAGVGVYGVLAYAVAQRTQEIGVRVALGADRSQVLSLVVGQGLRLAGTGIAVGLVLAAIGMPLARSLLYGVSPFDPASFGAVTVFLLLVALMASYFPAVRATRVDPLVALREE